MKRIFALLAVLVIGALGMAACGGDAKNTAANNVANANKMVANAMNAVNSAMSQANSAMNAASNAMSQANSAMNAVSNAMKAANTMKPGDAKSDSKTGAPANANAAKH